MEVAHAEVRGRELHVREAQQRYEPLGERRVRFSSGSFRADLLFDEDGFVVDYPGLARRA